MSVGYKSVVVVLAAFLSACGAKSLSKEQAKTMLSDYYEKNPATQPVLTGMASIGPSPEAGYFSNSPDGKYQKALESEGLITITSKGKVVNPDDKRQWFNALDINLTDKGKKYVTGQPKTVPATTPNTWPTVYENAVFCTREIVDIANITTTDDFARADYSYRFGKLTPFYLQFQKTDPTDHATCSTAAVQNGSATFELHDDAWRLSPDQK